MSFHDATEPECTRCEGSIELSVRPREKDLGEFTVRRVLPAIERRSVGPFVFFDHMGPAEFPPGEGIAVRPHPHIGLATVTYLFEGTIMHRDSLGVVQAIGPGAVNLMTAGRGIVHSERAGDDLHTVSHLHGIQTWMALPEDRQEIDPAFEHTPAADLPVVEKDGVHARLIMGAGWGERSPVTQHSPTFYAEAWVDAGAVLTLPDGLAESAVYVVDGALEGTGETFERGVMAIVRPGERLGIRAREDSHVMIIGGAPLGRRHMWWNFVSTSRDRIEQAKRDWREGRFDAVPGDDAFIPLPD